MMERFLSVRRIRGRRKRRRRRRMMIMMMTIVILMLMPILMPILIQGERNYNTDIIPMLPVPITLVDKLYKLYHKH